MMRTKFKIEKPATSDNFYYEILFWELNPDTRNKKLKFKGIFENGTSRVEYAKK